jgi:transketolase
VRTAFIDALTDLAEHDERVWLLCGDLGYSVLERFASQFPDRFVNVGVAEQNMTGVAAGLALCDKIVFTYSIANFPIMRCLEQIRNDVCYHNLNVKIVAVGAGMAYSAQGYTHHGVEDLAVMRVMPHMTVVAPSDPVEARLTARAVVDRPGPCYIRLGKSGEPVLHDVPPHFVIGEAITMRPGKDITLISTGSVLNMTLAAARVLEERGISAWVLSMPTVQPIDREAVHRALKDTGKIITVEEHGMGGLGSAVAELIAEAEIATRFRQIRLESRPTTVAGSQTKLLEDHKISAAHISDLALGLFQF